MARKPKKAPPPTAAELLERHGLAPDDAGLRPAWLKRRDELNRALRIERRTKDRAAVKQMPDGYRDVAIEQERHDPSVPMTVRDDVRINQKTGRPEALQVGVTVMRGSQARMLSSLDRWQRQAFDDIYEVIQSIFPETRTQGQTFERQARGYDSGVESDRRIDDNALYFRWANALIRRGIKHAWIWLIVVKGYNLETCVTELRSDKRTVKRHLSAALDQWCMERGWIKMETEALASFQPKAGARTVYEATK